MLAVQRRSESGRVVDDELVVRVRSQRRVTEEAHRWRACWQGLGHLGREAQVSQDLPNDSGVIDQRYQPNPTSTAGTDQDVDAHAATHQVRPGIVALGARVRRLRVRIGGRVGIRGIGRAVESPELNDERPPRRAWPQDTVIEDQVDAWTRRERGEPFQQFDRIEQKMRGPIRPLTPQLEPDLAVVGPLKPFLSHGRPQGVTSETFETFALVRGDAKPGMEIEAVVTPVARSESGRCGRGRHDGAAAADAGAGPGIAHPSTSRQSA